MDVRTQRDTHNQMCGHNIVGEPRERRTSKTTNLHKNQAFGVGKVEEMCKGRRFIDVSLGNYSFLSHFAWPLNITPLPKYQPHQ